MTETTALITGANRGIGLELARQLKARGAHVIATCRSESEELKALNIDIRAGIDVTNQDQLNALSQSLEGVTLDLLVNNAGILTKESLEDLNFERIQRQFDVNTLGPLRVTHALLNRLKSGSRIAIISSRMGSIGDNTSGSRYGYRMSKAAINMAGVSLAQDLKPRGIPVAILHPGLVSTGMTGFTSHGIPPAEAARGLLQRIDELNLNNSGTFWHQNGDVLPW